jgi:dephospho-CoA kinase
MHGCVVRCQGFCAGAIDRDALGALIYQDRQARRKLNAATHPAVSLELAKQLLWHWLRCHWLVVSPRPLANFTAQTHTDWHGLRMQGNRC